MLTRADLLWTAGFLEGEGSFMADRGTRKQQVKHGVSVAACQVQAWPLMKLKRLVGGSVYPVDRCRKLGQSLYCRWRVSGPTAAGLCMTLYSMMSPRRKRQIRSALQWWGLGSVSHKYKAYCKYGHSFNEENTRHVKYSNNLRRVCRTCERRVGAAKREKRRAA